MPSTVVLLHGFTGTGASWRSVAQHLGARWRAIAPDLRGHGERGAARPADFAGCTQDVLAMSPQRFALAGYSMGGRLALAIALAHPERVERLVLVSASAGIEDDHERARRRAADERLAARIERDGVERFAADWARQPLFADQPPGVAAAAHADRMRNDAAGLAASLRGMGSGVMAPLWTRLPELTIPVTLVAGERDAKFTGLAGRMAAAIVNARLVIVAGAGHAVHLEAPERVAACIDVAGQPP